MIGKELNSPFPSRPKPLHQSEAWCTTIQMEMKINLHVNEISFSYERMSTKTRFESEAKGNSEMAYCFSSVARKKLTEATLFVCLFSYLLALLYFLPSNNNNNNNRNEELTERSSSVCLFLVSALALCLDLLKGLKFFACICCI